MDGLQEISIKNYRALNEISFQPKAVNIFVGPNNSGKSSILEAVALLISGRNKCKDSLGVSVLNEIIQKYSIEYLIRGLNQSIQIAYGDSKMFVELYSSGYPKDETGTMIQNFFSQKIHEYLSQPDTLARYKSRYNEERKYYFRSSPKAKQITLDGMIPSDIQSRLYDIDENNEYVDQTLADYIGLLQEKFESYMYNKNKIVISGFSNNALDYLYVALGPEKPRYLLRREEVFEFLRYFYGDDGVFTVHSSNSNKANFVSDIGSSGNARKVEDLHDEVVRRNLMSESQDWLISKIPYIEDIRKTDEGMFVSLNGYDRTIPLSSMGDGLKSILKIVYLSVLAKNGVIVLEEPEVSLHPGYIEMLADSILFCSKNTQFFISTHSEDLIESLLESANNIECLDTVQVIKMHNRTDIHASEAEVISGSEALDDIETINADLRGV
ncbi:AAA family ATPase [Methanofollis ethanolicus]|uniref:AAA family ATPase n=1 Tax=Methanofollis ethanolicus TaxID=488124 RepID=UPI0009FA6145|nr:ATP-binding protein [Methanofollis ethanolicus]